MVLEDDAIASGHFYPRVFDRNNSPRNTRCQSAVCSREFWSSELEVFPQCRHQAVGKETGFTSYIERFNQTMGQRISRLRQKNLGFF